MNSREGYFSQNMAVLRRHYPLLAAELDKTSGKKAETGDCRIEVSSSGAPTMIYKGVYLHSRRDPKREAERLVETEPENTLSLPVLILGFGLGYTAAAFAEKYPGRPIIIVEKHPELLIKALETKDFTAFFTKNPLIFVLGGTGEAVTEALSFFDIPSGAFPPVIQNRALTGIDEDSEWYGAVNEKIKLFASRVNVNRATQKRFGKRWIRNLSKNLSFVRDIPGISRLAGLLSETDIPVFLAAAGPTLDNAAPFLVEIHKRCLVVALDTSLRLLLNRGAPPDFAVSVDPQYWNFRHLDRVPAQKTRLVAESAVYPPCLRHQFAGILLCGSFFPLGRFIEEKTDPKGDLGAGGSVATSAWDFIRLLGTKEVWIAGLDLSFPDLKTHFRGAVFEEKSHTESGRFIPAETWNFRALRDGQRFYAKRKGGGLVLTDKRLSLYAAWFENRFKEYAHIREITLSDEGLDIKGLESSDVKSLLSLPERRGEIEKILEKAFCGMEIEFNSKEAVKIRAEKYEKARKSLLSGLNDIKKTAKDAAEIAEKAAKRAPRLDKSEEERAIKKLDAANKRITESAVKEIAGFLFPETDEWEAEIAAKTKDPLVRHFEFSARFYRALYEAADYNLKVLCGA